MSILPLPKKNKDVAHQPPVVCYEPKSESQQIARDLYKTRDVLFLIGPAGTGKTLTAIGLGAVDVCGKSLREKIVIVRPAVVADRELGYIKGTLEEKLAPYAEPIWDNLTKIAFHFPPDKLVIESLGYLRGRTFDNTVLIVDEAQNLTYHQALMVLTRIGKDSKVVFCGDPEQCDLRTKGKDLEEVVERVEGHPRIGVVRFSAKESLRHPLIQELLLRLLPR